MSLHNEGFCSKWIAIIGSFVLFCAIAGILLYQNHSTTPIQPANDIAKLTAAAKSRFGANYLKAPLNFEVNQGQTNDQVKYLSRGQGYTLFLTPSELVFTFATTNKNQQTTVEVLRAGFVGANQHPTITADNKSITKTNYFIGNDSKKWHTNIPNFAKVNYQNLYPGIDAVFYGNQARLEYDIRVAPHADPKVFRLSFTGAKKLSLNQQGDLILTTAAGKTVSMHKPEIYQALATGKHSIDGSFVLLGNNQVGFKVGNYDQNQPLVIDPILYYSTYLGGTGENYATGIAIDGSSQAYVTGYTTSTDFPTNSAAFQQVINGHTNAFIAKFANFAYQFSYITYLGGDNYDFARKIAVDSEDNVYVTGSTNSSNFPTVATHTYNLNLQGARNVFLTKLANSGSSLSYSTYLGGNHVDEGLGIAINNINRVYLTGNTNSTNFPTTINAYNTTLEGTRNAFVTQIDPTKNGTSSLIYSTYFGGNQSDSGNDIAIDNIYNRAYITGSTTSPNFPTTSSAYNLTLEGTQNAFVTIINPAALSGSASLIYSTYLGGNHIDTGNGINLASGSLYIYITGTTNSTNFPVNDSSVALQSTLNGAQAAFITRFDNAQNLAYSTYLGSNITDSAATSGASITVDRVENVYVTGTTNSTNFPTQNAFQTSLAGTQDAFVTKITLPHEPVTNTTLVYSTYLGGTGADNFGTGIAVDALYNFYVSGYTNSGTFPIGTSNAYSLYKTGSSANAFITRFSSFQSDDPAHAWTWIQHFFGTFPDTLDVFDIMPTNDGVLWAIARNATDSAFGNVYLSNNTTEPTWITCSQDTANLSIGRFGIDRYASNSSYIPSATDVKLMAHTGTPPDSCAGAPLSNSNTSSTEGAVAFLQTSATNAYYVQANGTGTGSDNIMVGTFSGGNWSWLPRVPDAHPTNFRINYIDGSDAAKRVFIATNNGTYSCSSNDYPTCTNGTWIKNPNLPADASFSRVFYEYQPAIPTALVPERDVLIVGGDGSNVDSSGIYVSANNGTTWSPKTTVMGNITTGIYADIAYVYVSAYSFAVPAAQNRANLAAFYSPNNLKQQDCHHLKPILNTLTSGGVTIAKVYNHGNDLTVTPIANFSGDTTFNSNAVLDLRAHRGDSGVADALYVPSLGPICNFGGFHISTPSFIDGAVSPITQTIRKGDTKTFTMGGMYSDLTVHDFTHEATTTWTSSNTDVATMSSNVATAIATGTTYINATLTTVLGSPTFSTTLTVSAPTVDSIAITPVDPTIHTNTTQAFTATATYSDGTTGNLPATPNWSSSNTSVASMTDNVATGNNAGTATITVTYESLSNTTQLTVNGANLTSVAVTPSPASVIVNGTQQFTATADYDDLSTQNVTAQSGCNWASSTLAVATVDNGTNKGLATGVGPGTTIITANFQTAPPASAILQVNPGPSHHPVKTKKPHKH